MAFSSILLLLNQESHEGETHISDFHVIRIIIPQEQEGTCPYGATGDGVVCPSSDQPAGCELWDAHC